MLLLTLGREPPQSCVQTSPSASQCMVSTQLLSNLVPDTLLLISEKQSSSFLLWVSPPRMSCPCLSESSQQPTGSKLLIQVCRGQKGTSVAAWPRSSVTPGGPLCLSALCCPCLGALDSAVPWGWSYLTRDFRPSNQEMF